MFHFRLNSFLDEEKFEQNLDQNHSLCIKEKYSKIHFCPNFFNNKPLFTKIIKVVSNFTYTEQQKALEILLAWAAQDFLEIISIS